MEQQTRVLEYKCPCCGAGLVFGDAVQKMKCAYCDNEFDLDTVRTYNESLESPEESPLSWEETEQQHWTEEEEAILKTFNCPSCGGEILTEETTAATFCPYCENPTILPGRVSGGIKPDGVIPFKTSKEDAKAAFLQLCKGKPLLPKLFTQEHRLEKITGMYVPFWLYDCSSDFKAQYKATRIHRWSDSRYHYTRTEHFHLMREATADFASIPMDASQKMDNAIMESIEPYDYSQMVDFETAYLSGFLADKYDVESKQGEERIRQRISASMNALMQDTLLGYATCVPVNTRLQVDHGKAHYVLLPVWMLHTKYGEDTYVFAMNGQTGKITGTFPICPKRTAAWFAAICAAVTAIASVIQMLLI